MPPEAPEVDITQWLTPVEALQILESALEDRSLAINVLLERLRGDMVPSAAFDTKVEGNLRGAEYGRLKPEVWKNVTIYDSVWRKGDLTHEARNPRSPYGGTITVRHFGVRFEPTSVQAIIPPRNVGNAEPIIPYQQSAETNPPKNKGGRPPKDWWADLWIEMCRQIYSGDIQFTQETRQADIERAMHEWASKHRHDVSDATIRVAANKLFRALKAEAEN
jgi:hypothetical protein